MLDRDATGFKDKRNVEFNGQLALNYEIFKGLKARAFFAYDYTNLAQKEMKTAVRSIPTIRFKIRITR